MRACLAWVWLIGVSCAVGALGCGDDASTGWEEAGVLLLRLGARPADVRCLSVQIAAGERSIERRIDVDSDGPFRVSRLPATQVTLNVYAYLDACAQVTPASVPSWLSDPSDLPVTLLRGQLTTVSLTMRPNADADLGLDLVWADDTTVSACPGEDESIDLDQNGVSDCVENLVQNGQFAFGLEGWSAGEGFEIALADDANGSAQSGAIQVTNTLTSEGFNGMLRGPAQCVSLAETTSHVFSAQAFIPSGQGVSGLFGAVFVAEFEDAACTLRNNHGITQQPVVFTDSWQRAQMQLVTTAGVASALVGVGVSKSPSDPDPGTVIFDDFLVHAVP